MTTIEEQAERHKATMDFFRSGRQLAEEIAIEIKRIESEERKALEESWQSRQATDKEEKCE